MKTSVGTTVLWTLILLCLVGITASAQVQWALDTVIATGAYTSGIAITPDGGKLVVSNNTNPGAVKIISTSNYAITNIDISSIENYPNGTAITPDGSTALVSTLHKIVFIDLSNNTIKGNFAAPCVGTTLYGLAVTPNGLNAIFPDLSSGCTLGGLRSMNATSPSGSSFFQVNTSGVLYGIAITQDSASAIVTTFSSDFPKKVNLSTFGSQNITGFSGSYGVATLHHSNEALIEGDSLKRVSLTSNTATKVISDIYSTALQGITITADDKYAFVVGSFEKVVVELASNTVIQTFSAGGTAVATMSDGSRFFVTDSYNGTVRVYKKINPTGIHDLKVDGEIPSSFTLSQNYPNPFNPTTMIQFTVPSNGHVVLRVFNTLGQEVATLFDGEAATGIYHQVRFNTSNLASGVYFSRLEFDGKMQLKKMLLLK